MSIWNDIKQAEKELKEFGERIAQKESQLKAKGIQIDYSSIEKSESHKKPKGKEKGRSIWETINEIREQLNAKKKYLESLENKCDDELANTK